MKNMNETTDVQQPESTATSTGDTLQCYGGLMFQFVVSTMLATYYEHLNTFGHDAFSERHRLSVAGINCSVCLHLGAAKRYMDQIEDKEKSRQ